MHQHSVQLSGDEVLPFVTVVAVTVVCLPVDSEVLQMVVGKHMQQQHQDNARLTVIVVVVIVVTAGSRQILL